MLSLFDHTAAEVEVTRVFVYFRVSASLRPGRRRGETNVDYVSRVRSISPYAVLALARPILPVSHRRRSLHRQSPVNATLAPPASKREGGAVHFLGGADFPPLLPSSFSGTLSHNRRPLFLPQ